MSFGGTAPTSCQARSCVFASYRRHRARSVPTEGLRFRCIFATSVGRHASIRQPSPAVAISRQHSTIAGHLPHFGQRRWDLLSLRCQGASSKKAITEATHMPRLARQGGEAGVCCSTLRVARSVGT